MDAKIRVGNGIKIEVNDDGDYIVAHVEDHNFIDRFYGLIEKLKGIHASLKAEESKGLSEKEQLDLVKDKMLEIMRAIDELFGQDTCKKVFGSGIVPNGYLIAEFFEQLEPIFREYAVKRQDTISQKYNRNRGHGHNRR